jgi:serralysin
MSSKVELSESTIPNYKSDSSLSSNPDSNITFGTASARRANPNPSPNLNTSPNFVRATGNSELSNYSQSPSAILTVAQADTLVKGGVSVAIAQAGAIFSSDENFSQLFTDSIVIGTEGQFTGRTDTNTAILGSFKVAANQAFSFDFAADLALSAKEIENPDVEFNKAQSRSSFLVLDTTNPDAPKVLDYFGIRGNLVSSKKIGDLKIGGSRNVKINSRDKTADIDGNNGTDSLSGESTGTYRQTFGSDKNITIVELNSSAAELAGDTLIGNLGKDVIYGTIRSDTLNGTDGNDKIYASLGDDRLFGRNGNDVLEAGQGKDRLDGGSGNDKLYGGLGDDMLIGSRGSDLLVGGDGADQFVFRRNMISNGDQDIIQDFQVGTDKIVFQNWGSPNPEQWLKDLFSQGNITDTKDGALFKLDGMGNNQGTLLFAGLAANQITSQSIMFG